jgi:hypothetical protein
MNKVGKGVGEYNEESGAKGRKLRTNPYREYAPGDMFYRKRNPMREFKSETDKEKYKIARKLQARWEGPYRIVRRLNPVLYETEVEGKKVTVHAINMKPDGRPSGPVQVMVPGEMRYSVLGRGTGSCADLARGRMNGREHIGDGDVEEVMEVRDEIEEGGILLRRRRKGGGVV